MAMVLRLSDEDAMALRHCADREGRSMQETVHAAVSEYVERHRREELLEQVLDSELPRYADALRRLEE